MAIFLSEERKKPLEFETHVDTTELEKALEKAERLVELLEKAQELSANLPQSTE
jgi:benzoyl-CoA reductase/2-hydroxyglutaryl-CoA dehydratase subunit BcrC/BadD/HgdB